MILMSYLEFEEFLYEALIDGDEDLLEGLWRSPITVLPPERRVENEGSH